MNKIVHLFAGPSLFEKSIKMFRSGNIRLYPPVKRNDVTKLILNNVEPGTLIIADGNFHNVLSVSHAEIRRAIQYDWEVWGCSSMGAIRACEMRELGMKGYGYVYKLFASNEDFTDDEVALLHTPKQPYHPISEPLVNIRFFLNNYDLVKNNALVVQGDLIVKFEEMWYGNRTLNQLRKSLVDVGLSKELVDKGLSDFDQYRIKNIDLDNFLMEQPWKKRK